MDTRNRLTELRGGWSGGWKRLAEEHMWIYAEPTDTDNEVVKWRGGGGGGEVRVGRAAAGGGEESGRKWGSAVILSTI